ncbi:Phage regulatory protein Rha [Chromobacterium vaccinii]|nr:Phage regulatory protein Rha [Chromobacterium vaccinii]QND88649.1 Phage regulatory protein Rha [Chromobacterium vaccinii]
MTAMIQTEALPLVLAKDGPRIDSRVIAAELGIQHDNQIQTLEAHREHFERLGVFRFQTEKINPGRGRPARFALLNEDQAYFAATLARNTARAVEVKFRLVKAFSEARKAQEAKTGQYLPFYHLAHDATRQMAISAANSGSEVPEGIFHANIERMVNKALGIEAGQRDSLNAAQRNAVSTAYQLINAAIADTLAAGKGHDAAYQEAKRRVNDFARLFGPAAGRISA